jgi:hypothetical protein
MAEYKWFNAAAREVNTAARKVNTTAGRQEGTTREFILEPEGGSDFYWGFDYELGGLWSGGLGGCYGSGMGCG